MPRVSDVLHRETTRPPFHDHPLLAIWEMTRACARGACDGRHAVGTPLMTRSLLAGMREAGMARLAVSVDGENGAIHDAFRRVDGSFAQTMRPKAMERILGELGKCGVCPFRRVCGGSRARAYAMTGDVLASDPLCAYIPKGWSE